MNEVDKILKDAAKITGELYLAHRYVQTPMQALSFYCQSEPSDFTRRSTSLARACACATAKWWNLAASSISTTRRNSYFAQTACRFGASRALPVSISKH